MKRTALVKGSKVIVRQYRSGAGRAVPVLRTLEALGLGRIGKSREFTLNDAVIGMLRRVDHLVLVESAA